MRYLSVIYYDTFARFFCAIEDAVKVKDPSAEFLHLAIFPSGWLYMKHQGRNVQLLPWQICKSLSTDISLSVSNQELDSVAHYHAITGKRFGEKYLYALRGRAQRYIATMASYVENFRPDVILFSGDTRIACESLSFCLDRSGYTGRRYFFEQGPNGTTIFDTKGVNANCSFRKSVAELTGSGYSPEAVARPQRFKRNPIFRGIDYALIGLLRLFNAVPPEWDTMSLEKYPTSDYRQCLASGRKNIQENIKHILVALQVPDDANNIHHNPLGLGDRELVSMVMTAAKALPYPIRVREHPLYKQRYSGEMYELLSNSQRAALSETSLDDDLSNAVVVVTVNSMTGLDAYLRRLPTIVLGNAFYDHLPGITRVTNESSLQSSLVELSDGGLDKLITGRDPLAIFAELRARYFIPGHYLDDSLEITAQRIAEKLV
ncbi:capsular polysaccharide export protein, LipB/KpsS family [Pectobacterium brasiliense]|uniref:capsular polysaccharide export protein, LipB/KpsS family n=1 Tax=Pectobacterium brasiliense TaxID=180957 RepID=UPI00057DF89F|nr:hypothetical protein [Pectobacterium brasiliense]KHT39449.1 hypothetical protein RD02_17030 [Pectobacterium brasiliense]